MRLLRLCTICYLPQLGAAALALGLRQRELLAQRLRLRTITQQHGATQQQHGAPPSACATCERSQQPQRGQLRIAAQPPPRWEGRRRRGCARGSARFDPWQPQCSDHARDGAGFSALADAHSQRAACRASCALHLRCLEPELLAQSRDVPARRHRAADATCNVQHATCGKRYGLRRATCTARRAVTARAFVPRLHSRLRPDRSAHLTVRVPHGPHPGGTQRTRRYSLWRYPAYSAVLTMAGGRAGWRKRTARAGRAAPSRG